MYRSIATLVIFAGLALAFSPAARANVKACNESGRLVIYTSQFEPDIKALANGFTFKCSNVSVEWVRASTLRLLDMISAELAVGKPKADVVILSDALHMLTLKLDNRLLPLPEVDVSEFDPPLYDIDRTYFGTKIISTVLIGRPDGKTLPKSWRELETAAAGSIVSYPQVLRSINATNYLFAILDQPDLGWRHIERLAKAGVRANSTLGEAIISVAIGEADLGLSVDYLAIEARDAGAPISVIFPQDGVPAVTEPIAIFSSTENKSAAIAFLNYVLSDRGQALAASHGFVPAKRSHPVPPGFPDRDSIPFVIPNKVEALTTSAQVRHRFVTVFQHDKHNQ